MRNFTPHWFLCVNNTICAHIPSAKRSLFQLLFKRSLDVEMSNQLNQNKSNLCKLSRCEDILINHLFLCTMCGPYNDV